MGVLPLNWDPRHMSQWPITLQMNYFPMLVSEGLASTFISKDTATGMILTFNYITF